MRSILSIVAVMMVAVQVWAGSIVESERKIPVIKEVDVVVVGGSCGAVAAAQSAAKSGVKVFLAAPRAYLGDDIAGTLRLALEDGEVPESPLANLLYTVDVKDGAQFTYKANVKPNEKHKDSGERLADGLYTDATTHSVQYDKDVTITADLAADTEIKSVDVMAFRRKNDFQVGGVMVSTTADGKTWSEPVAMKQVEGDEPDMDRFTLEQGAKLRSLKFTVKMKEGIKRILLGEIVLHSAGAGTSVPVKVPTLLRVKQVLDKTLLDSGVEFLTGCFVTDVLSDADGKPAGVVIANRSGRQAVTAKVIIDATERGYIARMAGAKFQPYPAGKQVFTKIIIAGEVPSAKDMTVRALPGSYDVPASASRKSSIQRVDGKVYECILKIDMKDGSFRSFAEAEQVAMDRTFVKTQLDSGDTLFQVPPDPMAGVASLKGEWPGCDKVDIKCFVPAGIERFYLLGGCADMDRVAASKMLRPLTLISVGEKIGSAAAEAAKNIQAPKGVKLAGKKEAGKSAGEVKEFLTGVRPFQSGLPVIVSEKTALPVLGEYDVVVVGAGTGGAPAGIGAARQKAKTLVIEYLYAMGGISTIGMIGSYYHGNRCGFTTEHDEGVKELNAAVHIIGKAEWFRRENRNAGAEIWFGTMGCGTLVDGKTVKGVVVATPAGRGVVLAKAVVDATGNSDVAAAAGAECIFQGGEEIAQQGVGLSPKRLGASYINSDFGYVNDSDAYDLWLFGVRGRAGCKSTWDVSQIVESRERRRIIGDYFITPLDILNNRTFPDTVTRAKSNFDSHGYTIADICYVSEPRQERVSIANIPYRSLLPKGMENVMVIGLGISAHRDAMPIMRMQPDIQNQGYVAGVAGAMASRDGKTFREIDVKNLQKHLVEKAIIPKEVLEWKDSWPVNSEALIMSVKSLGDNYKDVSTVLAHADQTLPEMRKAYAEAKDSAAKLVYAHVLGILGDATGVDMLISVVDKTEWGGGWNFKAMGQFGRSVSELDSYMIALGRTRDKKALDPIIKKAVQLDAKRSFSNYRAVTLALEAIGDPAGAKVLADILGRPGIGGHAMVSAKDIGPAGGYTGLSGDNERAACLREIALARALYRCGDYEGLGERILKQYAQDLRGLYALHATEVLKGGKSGSGKR